MPSLAAHFRDGKERKGHLKNKGASIGVMELMRIRGWELATTCLRYLGAVAAAGVV